MKFNFWKKTIQLKEFESQKLIEISSFLTAHENQLVDDITAVLKGDYGLLKRYTKEHVKFFDFELSADGFGIHFYPSDANNTQLGHKQLLPEYPNGFVNDNDFLVYAEDFDNDDDRMDEYDEQLKKKVLDWFIACWKEAGGFGCKERYILKVHDVGKSFDLKNQKWISDH